MDEQVRMLKEYEAKQAALNAQREAEERQRLEMEQQQQREFEQRQLEQAEAQRLAQEQLMQQQMMYQNQNAIQQSGELERELLAMRGQYERDQIFLEQYDRVRNRVICRGPWIDLRTARQSTRVGTQCHQCPCQFATGDQGRADKTAPRSSYPLAQQIRSAC